MNQQHYNIKTLFNTYGQTGVSTGTYVDLTPSASISKRSMKVIFAYQVQTAGTFSVGIQECNTTGGTYTDVTFVETTPGLTGIYGTNATYGLVECHAMFTKRYAKAAITTVNPTTGTINVFIGVQNLKPVV